MTINKALICCRLCAYGALHRAVPLLQPKVCFTNCTVIAAKFQKKITSSLELSAPYRALNSTLLSSCITGQNVSFMSSSPLFLISRCEQSTTTLSSFSEDKAPDMCQQGPQRSQGQERESAYLHLKDR